MCRHYNNNNLCWLIWLGKWYYSTSRKPLLCPAPRLDDSIPAPPSPSNPHRNKTAEVLYGWEGWKHWSPGISSLVASPLFLCFTYANSSSFPVLSTLLRRPKWGVVGDGLVVSALSAAPGRWSVRTAQQALPLKAHPGFHYLLETKLGAGRGSVSPGLLCSPAMTVVCRWEGQSQTSVLLT